MLLQIYAQQHLLTNTKEVRRFWKMMILKISLKKQEVLTCWIIFRAAVTQLREKEINFTWKNSLDFALNQKQILGIATMTELEEQTILLIASYLLLETALINLFMNWLVTMLRRTAARSFRKSKHRNLHRRLNQLHMRK